MLDNTLVRTLLLAAGTVAAAHSATVLTFDVNGIANFANINQAYGDNVASASDASGSYGNVGGTWTPNVTVAYGSAGEDPALWTTG